MIRYHLASLLRRPLLLVLALLIFMTIYGFRRGGTYSVDVFRYVQLFDYWGIVGPALVFGLALSAPVRVYARAEHDPIVLTRPRVITAIRDSLARLIALMIPIAVVGVAACAFLSSRVPDAASTYVPGIGVRDPVTVTAVWMVFVVGPLPGAAAVLAISEFVGTMLRSNLLRLVMVGLAGFMDLTRSSADPFLSLTAATRRLAEQGYWGKYFSNEGGRPFAGPYTTDLDPSLLAARGTLLLLAIAVMSLLGFLQVQGLRRALQQASPIEAHGGL